MKSPSWILSNGGNSNGSVLAEKNGFGGAGGGGSGCGGSGCGGCAGGGGATGPVGVVECEPHAAARMRARARSRFTHVS
jgi:hypothetical protein